MRPALCGATMNKDAPILPYGITNSAENGRFVYHCPYCQITTQSAVNFEGAERAKQDMVNHVLFMHRDETKQKP